MNEDMTALQETVAALRAELDKVKGKLARIERVVRCGDEEDDEEEGGFAAYLECAGLVIRDVKDPRHFAVHLGANEGGGYVSIHYQGESDVAIQSAILLHMENNEPHIQVRGKDWKPRTDTFIVNDCGATAVFSPGGSPGAIMRAQPAGGSVAVLQPDGKTRAALIHSEKPEGKDGPETDLIFALPDGNSVLKLHADAGGGMMSMGPPGYPNAAMMVGREPGGSVMLRSSDEGTSIALLATAGMAKISAMQGVNPSEGCQASLMANKTHSAMSLRRPNGGKGVDLASHEETGVLSLYDEGGEEAVELSHSGTHACFNLKGMSAHEGIRMYAGNDATFSEVVSPVDPHTKVVNMVGGGKPMVMVRQDDLPLAIMGESNGSGTICAYGPNAEQAGIACLSGGPITGSLSLSQPDGTQLLTLDGTDHGGRLAINNDLGFQRIVMGVHEESAGLRLNHTGNRGVDLSATEGGGVVVVCDTEGKVIGSLPALDEEG